MLAASAQMMCSAQHVVGQRLSAVSGGWKPAPYQQHPINQSTCVFCAPDQHHCACVLLPVHQVVIDRLVSSACFSQPRGLALEPLSSYQILYDCVMAWGHYKHAAAAMLAFARRLRGMAAAAAAGGSSSSQADRRQTRQVVTEVQAAYGESSAPPAHLKTCRGLLSVACMQIGPAHSILRVLCCCMGVDVDCALDVW
jgi:hypothetical protein